MDLVLTTIQPHKVDGLWQLGPLAQPFDLLADAASLSGVFALKDGDGVTFVKVALHVLTAKLDVVTVAVEIGWLEENIFALHVLDGAFSSLKLTLVYTDLVADVELGGKILNEKFDELAGLFIIARVILDLAVEITTELFVYLEEPLSLIKGRPHTGLLPLA